MRSFINWHLIFCSDKTHRHRRLLQVHNWIIWSSALHIFSIDSFLSCALIVLLIFLFEESSSSHRSSKSSSCAACDGNNRQTAVFSSVVIACRVLFTITIRNTQESSSSLISSTSSWHRESYQILEILCATQSYIRTQPLQQLHQTLFRAATFAHVLVWTQIH